MKKINIVDTLNLIGKKVTLFGRARTIRDHGKLVFIDLVDASGIIQTVSRNKVEATPEDILEIEGTVKKRPANLVNRDIETGEIEVEIEKLKVIAKSQPLPIPIEGDGYDIEESLRLKYRYLDLRRERFQKNLKLRHQVVTVCREFLNKEGFLEIETPYLSKTTPEGARDFLVPSRLSPGKFYALAQSPQQYKQLLMISGIEKYYQIARAFRDEDMRADRQFEHTQIDIEMAYVTRDDVLNLVESMYKYVANAIGRKIFKEPFPIFTYDEALKKFQQDKFDLRHDKDNQMLAFAWVVDFPLLEYDKAEKRYTFSHNPFTAPSVKDIENLMNLKELDKLSSYQYDLVLNGYEVGSGSIRITDSIIQKQVFRAMGYSEKKISEDFGHLLDAYQFGAPPHGGIALGLDRFCAVLAGETNIREVIAFPTSGSGQTSVMDAPSKVDAKILNELKLKTLTSKDKK